MTPQTDSHTPEPAVTEMDSDYACFVKAKDKGEPTFTIRAQDRSASETVEFWAVINALELVVHHPKVIEAKAIAAKMRAWPHQKQAD